LSESELPESDDPEELELPPHAASDNAITEAINVANNFFLIVISPFLYI
jgi:hypothetical protein